MCGGPSLYLLVYKHPVLVQKLTNIRLQPQSQVYLWLNGEIKLGGTDIRSRKREQHIFMLRRQLQ